MTDDPTRAMELRSPSHGNLGPPDPRTDPATRPTMRPADGRAPEGRTVPTPADRPVPEGPTVPTPADRGPVPHSRTGVLWTGLILSALVLLFLLIFILQNTAPVQITFLGLSGTLPTGVALLLAAIAGLLLVAIPGGLRILQLRRAARRPR
jgi:uncharacterized integral membrane protein